MPAIRAHYHLRCARDAIERRAQALAREQTLEVPEPLVPGNRLPGRVVSIAPLPGPGRFAVVIDYDARLASGQLPQLLNLLFGNVSIQAAVRLVDFELPEPLLERFRGPRVGGPELRARSGVFGRPLLATALKPRGAAPGELARVAREFALGGGDLVKDDHNLVDDSLESFLERVRACADAVCRANEATGRSCLYLANLCAPVEQLERFLDAALHCGCAGVLVAPMLLGLDTVRRLAGASDCVIMAHPSLAGSWFQDRSQGIEPGLLLGRLFRLAGAGISIFPHPGGRFGLGREECASIAHSLRAPLGRIRSALPAPAGGMGPDRIDELAADYGADAVHLVGGALLAGGRSVREQTVRYLDLLRARFPERIEEPLPATVDGAAALRRFLPADFAWEGCEPRLYKRAGELRFRGVSRRELVGPAGERTAFELRYLEVEAGGFTSRERHVHAHAIVVLRGHGVLEVGADVLRLAPHDVAYIPPLAVHQLRNESDGVPFGFLCIVDRERDRPLPA